MNKFTVEEINFMCVFEAQNRTEMMKNGYQHCSKVS